MAGLATDPMEQPVRLLSECYHPLSPRDLSRREWTCESRDRSGAELKQCNQCGKCCTKYSDGGLVATADEIEWWEQFQPEIARYVRGEKIWMDPETSQQLKICPWLIKSPNEEKYTCAIYHNRPDDCRHYPVNIEQMVVDECEMLEPRDLTDTIRAQRTLDDMMNDSRPPSNSR